MSLDGRDQGRLVVFGEVLFDRFPGGEEVLGGAPFNVAWNLRGLGASPCLVSRVGDDSLGERIVAAMTGWGLATSEIQIDRERPTGTVEVEFDDGEPVFQIVPDRAWDRIDPDALGPFEVGVIYHGSLACRSGRSRAALETLGRRRPASTFFDVNLRPPWWERRRIEGLLAGATEVKLNEEELRLLAPAGEDPPSRAAALLRDTAARRLHLTRGARGSLTFSGESGPMDGEPLEVRPRAGLDVVDTVGAGDAYSSVCILGGLRGWGLPETLARAGDFAAAVVGLRGATTTERGFYEEFRRAWRQR